jgi:hypothetical protein
MIWIFGAGVIPALFFAYGLNYRNSGSRFSRMRTHRDETAMDVSPGYDNNLTWQLRSTH